jgi:hypothetical protein
LGEGLLRGGASDGVLLRRGLLGGVFAGRSLVGRLLVGVLALDGALGSEVGLSPRPAGLPLLAMQPSRQPSVQAVDE